MRNLNFRNLARSNDENIQRSNPSNNLYLQVIIFSTEGSPIIRLSQTGGEVCCSLCLPLHSVIQTRQALITLAPEVVNENITINIILGSLVLGNLRSCPHPPIEVVNKRIIGAS